MIKELLQELLIENSSVNVEFLEMFIKKERLSAKWHRDLNLQKRNYPETPEKKKQAVNRRYDDKRESVKQYKKDIMWKIKYCI